jgi:hypothetical protein
MLPMLFEQKYPPNAIPKELKILWSKVHDALRAYANDLNAEGVDDVLEDFPDSWYQYSTPLNMDNLHILREYFEEVIAYINDKLGMNFYASYTCQITSFSKKGRELIPILKETVDDATYRYSFVNENGNRFLLPWKLDYKIGSTFMRPDTNTLAKIAGYQVVSYKDDKDLSEYLIQIANKVSDDAEGYISKKIKKLRDEGYAEDQAVAIAYEKARKKGYSVPDKSSSLNVAHVVKEDGGYFVTNKDKTKKLNKEPKTKEEATKMLQAIGINKHKGSLDDSTNTNPGQGFIPTSEGYQTPNDIVDNLMYSSYAYNRSLGITPAGWLRMVNHGVKDPAVIKKNTDTVNAMEKRYLHTLNSSTASLRIQSADISDEIPPMGWSEKNSKLPKPDGAGAALPPDKDLQNKPADAESGNVLYDSNKDKGPQYQVTMDPGDSSIKIKYIDSEAKDALENALNNNVPEFNKSMTPAPAQQQPGQPQPAAAPPPAGGQQNSQPSFNNQNIPVSF